MPEHIRVELDFIPVEERFPGVGEEVYLKRRECICIGCWYTDETEGFASWVTNEGECLEFDHVTHWAEIPRLEEAHE